MEKLDKRALNTWKLNKYGTDLTKLAEEVKNPIHFLSLLYTTMLSYYMPLISVIDRFGFFTGQVGPSNWKATTTRTSDPNIVQKKKEQSVPCWRSWRWEECRSRRPCNEDS